MDFRDKNVLMAKETLRILNDGELIIPRIGIINITDDIDYSWDNTFYIDRTSKPILDEARDGIIEVVNATTIGALKEVDDKRVAILNFASAKHPGGGFKTGAMAQEESLAYSSSLYDSLTKYQEWFYDANLKDLNNGLYTDKMIMSQMVIFFRDEKFNLCKPYYADVLTSCAVNAGVASKKGITQSVIRNTMDNRIKNILNELAMGDYEYIILGAFGCGVFRNKPHMIAEIFKKYLIDNDMKDFFDKIIFAIPEGRDNNLNVFKEILNS